MQTNPTIIDLPEFLYADESRSSGIYSITCSGSGKVYIGSAECISLRWRSHYRNLLKGSHHNSHLQRSWNKYGADVFRFDVIERVSVDELISREQHHIDSLPDELLLNLSPTAGSIRGFKQSAETCELMRAQRLGIAKHSEETKAKLSARFSGIARRQPGWKMTDEQKGILSERMSGRKLSDAHKAKVSATSRGRVHTDAVKERIAKSKVKLSSQQVQDVRSSYGCGGRTIQSLAREFGMNPELLGKAIRAVYPYDYNQPIPISRKTFRQTAEARATISEKLKGRPKPEGFGLKLLGNKNNPRSRRENT